MAHRVQRLPHASEGASYSVPVGQRGQGDAAALQQSTTVLSVIVPTYNERTTLPTLVTRLAALHSALPMELVVVDDASPDGTGVLADTLARSGMLPMTVVHRTEKSGLGSAVVEGAAASHGQILTVMDSDLSHPPDLLPELVAAIRAGADIAIASRYVMGGGVRRWPLPRRLVSRVATRLVRAVLGLQVNDPLSGFFALRREILTGQQYWALGYKLLTEILAKNRSRTIVEIPYQFVDRQRGESKLSWGEIVAFLRLLDRLRGRR